MATTTASRRRRAEAFEIHEDVPATEDTQLNDESATQREAADYTDENDHDASMPEEEMLEQDDSDLSDEEEVDSTVQGEMNKLGNTFPGFRSKYRLIKRIGEGTFSTVYKAEDLQYDHYDNSWDVERDDDGKWLPSPVSRGHSSSSVRATSHPPQRRKAKFVAIKKIYVTASPSRILNELELLHDLRNAPAVCPLITAFRHADQVVAILPYFRHHDFRDYFRDMTISDTAIYLRSLFTALREVHARGILHRDIKPTNFLYDPDTRRGVLVDFGLAEREGTETKPCLCHEEPLARKNKLRAMYTGSGPHSGYPKNDTRPSRRANRAGTRGFRAPEVLFKCTEQTPKIDIWSAGVILLTILSRRFPFFNSADDVEAMIEIGTIFGTRRMRNAAHLHGCSFESTIPTMGVTGFTLERIVLWSTCRPENDNKTEEERLAHHFLKGLLELDPSKRMSAAEALRHSFLQEKSEEDEYEMDMVQV